MDGVVVRIIGEKRFGFIRCVDGKEYFFHKDDLQGSFDHLTFDFETGKQIKVKFDSVESTKGLRAGNVVESME